MIITHKLPNTNPRQHLVTSLNLVSHFLIFFQPTSTYFSLSPFNKPPQLFLPFMVPALLHPNLVFLKRLSGTVGLVTLHFPKSSQCFSPCNGTVWAPLTTPPLLLVQSRHTIGHYLLLVAASHTVVCYIQQFLTSPAVIPHTPGSLLSLQAASALACSPYHFCNKLQFHP